MNIIEIIKEWFPAITTTSIFSIALWLSRNLIITRLTNSVKHEYDQKIESIKSDLRKNEEAFKAEIRIRETQIEALRSGVLSGLSNRQIAVFSKQISAIEEIWSAIISLAPAKMISNQMAVIKFEAAVKRSSTDEKVREMFSLIGNIDLEQLNTNQASKARPFVSPLAWAYFTAYQAIVMHAVAKLQILKFGVDAADVLDNEKVISLVKTALPNQIPTIEKYGTDSLHLFLDELEEKLLYSFQLTLKGESLSEEHLKMASEIIKKSESLVASDKLASSTK